MSNFKYTGSDNLDVMAAAVHYNTFLIENVVRHARDAKMLLDFGAGCGTFSRALREKGFAVSCVEPDASLRDKLQVQGFPCFTDISDVPAESADYVFSLNVLEHIKNDGEAVQRLFSTLRPGGRLFVYVPAFEILRTSMDEKVGHFRRYRTATLRKVLEDAGFAVEILRYADSLGFFATLLYRLIGDKSGDVNERSLKAYDRFIFPISRTLDVFCGPFFGKNVMAAAGKPR